MFANKINTMKKKTKKTALKKKRATKRSAKKNVIKKSSAKTKRNKKKTVTVKKKVARKTAVKKAKQKTKQKTKAKSIASRPAKTVTPSFRKKKNMEDELMEKPGIFVETEEQEIKFPVDSDITNEEIEEIDDDDLHSDMGDDEELKKRSWDVDMSGEDLDIPGTEYDNEMEELGSEDEENNPYSIGGDRHEDLEEDKDLGR